MIHPECGCTTQVMEYVAAGDVDPERTHMLSTGGMLDFARESDADTFIVATETGMLHPLAKENPSYMYLLGTFYRDGVATVKDPAKATEWFVKACEGGYDGRSQLRFDGSDAEAAWASLGGRPAVAEQALDLELELSVMVARRASGEIVVYPPAVNHHERQILAWSTVPGDVDPRVARDARELARGIAEQLQLEGLLAVEMFLLRDGRLLVNRPVDAGREPFFG